MQTEPILETAIREARGLLWANWPPVHNLPDAETVARLSKIISSSAVVGTLRMAKKTKSKTKKTKGRSIAEEEALGGQEERPEEVGRQEGEADGPQGRSPEVQGCSALQAR